MSPISLEGRFALVAGGNGGLGKAVALGLHEAGATIAVTGRNAEKNAAALKELAAVTQLDFRDEGAVSATIDAVTRRFGRLDIHANCAGSFRVPRLCQNDSIPVNGLGRAAP